MKWNNKILSIRGLKKYEEEKEYNDIFKITISFCEAINNLLISFSFW